MMHDTLPATAEIMTLRGNQPVAALRRGDMLLTLSGEGAALKPLLGCEPVAPPRAAILLRADAVAEAAPRRDLPLPADQAIRLGAGGPVRLAGLANGATITRATATGVWHRLTLPGADIVLVEGLPVALAQPGAADSMGRDALAARATALGWHETADPGLRVHAEDVELEPLSLSARECVVLLPPGAQHVLLRSRSAVPAEIDPENPDARRLGVALASLLRDGEVIALDDPAFAEGFLPPEPGLRWSDGAGLLRLPPQPRETLLEIRLRPIWARYPARRE